MPAAKPETIKAKDLMAMLERQGHRCAYSGRPLTPETATVDHVIPVSRGGTHDTGNLAIVHTDVNTAKASMTLEEFVQVCREVSQFARRHKT